MYPGWREEDEALKDRQTGGGDGGGTGELMGKADGQNGGIHATEKPSNRTEERLMMAELFPAALLWRILLFSCTSDNNQPC